MADKKRKYLLFSKDDKTPTSQKPCAFFFSSDGCRNGSKCLFSHDPKTNVSTPHAATAPAHVYSKSQPAKVEYKPNKEVTRADSSDDDSSDDDSTQSDARKVAPPLRQAPIDTTHKKQKTVEVAAAHVSAPVNMDILKQMEIKMQKEREMMQEQMLMQQKAFERQMAAQMQAQLMQAQQFVSQNSGKNATGNNNSNTKNQKKEPEAAKKVEKVPYENLIKQKATPKKSGSAVDDDDDEKFLFGAVNVALGRGLPATPAAKISSKGPAAPPGFGNIATSLALPIASPPSVLVAYSEAENNGKRSSSISSVAAIPVTVPPPMSTKNTGLVAGHWDANFVPSDYPFISSDSVMKVLSTSGTEHATLGNARFSKATAQGANSNVKSSAEIHASLVRMSVDFSKLEWQDLVDKCKKHARYEREYNFHGLTDSSWVQARPSDGRALPPVISIDCEMCQTTDPVTDKDDTSALIRFSVVNGLNPSEILIDSLVQPLMPVKDIRSNIHGITEAQLQGVSFTLRHAQAFLLNICSEDTIIVGHAVHNDLKALHFSHKNVVDTAYLYAIDGEAGAAASVRDISDQVLDIRLLDVHDSVQDARAALQAAAYILMNKTAPLIVRSAGAVRLSELFVHRIPEYCTEEHLHYMVINYTQVVPIKIAAITKGYADGGKDTKESFGKTTISFSSAEHCNLAFESIAGPNRPDKNMRGQKRVYLKNGGYVCCRK